MKRVGTIILLLVCLWALVIPCFAVEESPSAEETEIAFDNENAYTDDVSESVAVEALEYESSLAEASDESSEAQTAMPIQLDLDNENVYEGMTKAYKDGYVPAVNNGILTLVVPLIADSALKNNEIIVTPDLGNPNSSPFEYKNYQKSFYLESNPVNRRDDTDVLEYVDSYLVVFDLPLKTDRDNGIYSITLNIQARSENGALVQQSFACYVTILDGAVTEANTVVPATVSTSFSSGADTTTPESQPKILIKKHTLSASPVTAGDEFTVVATLWNTSETRDIQNLIVTASCDSSNFVLKNESDTIFVGDLEAGGSADIELTYDTDLETPAQRYSIRLSMEYDNSDAMTLSSSGSVMVEVAQALDVELAPFRMVSEVKAGETLQLAFQVMNLGRGPVYNVRLELDVPGLSPVGTAFIGNMEAGTSADTNMNVFVGVKDEDERYGFTSGSLHLIFEDVNGQEYVQETEISTTIQELVIGTGVEEEDEEDAAKASQWWISLVVGGVVIAGLLALLFGKKRVKV